MVVRLKDIAQDLGISIVSVSKALRNHPDIAKETRERILKRVKEMNYRPNLMARSLVTGRSSLIGMVVPDLVHPFFSEIAKSLSGALRKKDFFLIVSSSEGDPVLEQGEIEQMLAHRVDALVIASSQVEAGPLKEIREGPTPLILLDRSIPGLNCNLVGSDDRRIGELATGHLIETGRTRIAHITGPANSVGNARLEAYRETLARHNLSAPDEFVIRPGDASTDASGQSHGERAMKQLLNLRRRPDAIFCFNDLVAIGAMLAAFEAGVRIPEEIAIVGCGNYHYGHTLRVPLSTVDQQISELGVRTAKMIFNLLATEGPHRSRKVLLEPSLVVRRSSGAAGGKRPARRLA
jgi:LacI family transcriptional regulator